MSAVASRFEARTAPCGAQHSGEEYRTEDQHGLVTDDVRFSCGCRTSKEEFHDGSVHRKVVHHSGKVLIDEEFRGE
jgi:hypothetical protein